jgi:AraC-like DNA-binding protein
MLKQGSTGYLMAFGADFYAARSTELKQVYRRASQKTHCQLDAAGFEHLYACLTDIFREYTQREDRYLPAIEALLDVFLIRYVRPAKSLDGQDDHAAPYALERLDAFLELLDRHIGTQKQASDYARMLHLSLYQLNAITKSALGKTCSDLITERIILEAKRLLLVTTDQVSLVADQLGYDDVSYFIRFFKKKTGHSPERFRKNFK